MPSNYKSPFATSFKSAIKRGVPCSTVVENICKRNNKTPKTVFESLFKAGLCYRQKVNGQWIYWPCDGVKTNNTNAKVSQTEMWQNFVDWCITTGCCTPEQMKKNCGSQTVFMQNCKKFWSKQFTNGSVTGKTTGRKSTGSYKIGRKTTVSRRYSKAA
jgi:hypothetical protein